MEGFHSIGITLVTFFVMPNADSFTFVQITWTIGFMPCLLQMIEVMYLKKRYHQGILSGLWQKLFGETFVYQCNIILIISAFLLQVVGIILLCIRLKSVDKIIVYMFSVLLISVRYWVNFINIAENGDAFNTFRWSHINICNHEIPIISFIIHLWKIIVTFCTMVTVFLVGGENSTDNFKALFGQGDFIYCRFELHITSGIIPYNSRSSVSAVTILHIVSGFVMYKAGKRACMVQCQIIGFYLPIMTTALIGGIVFQMIYIGQLSTGFGIPEFDISNQDGTSSDDYLSYIASILLYISTFILLTKYNWKHGCTQTQTARMFVRDMFCGIFTDVSLLLSRTRNEDEGNPNQTENSDRVSKTSVKMYACATLWHENSNEMNQLLYSIYRLDRLHYVENRSYECINQERRMNEYDFEVHVFLDDAVLRTEGTTLYGNEHVSTFFDSIVEAGRSLYSPGFRIQPHKCFLTPYGGQILYELPGKTNVVLHLKDSKKIRKQKRCSQIMYMHYLLEHCSKTDTPSTKENTFIMALDGDVDFRPKAVTYLLQRMMKYPNVAAACGRIHPIGKSLSPYVWYQKFEYAVSHWLQKATEHVFGCVLCSPGCFSLYRGTALEKVLTEYSEQPKKAHHVIQYDQGEDRWLCTLLLKKGYEIDYCAESDARTYVPETFEEFFKQRRRWIPSTLANTFDLIFDMRDVCAKSNKITRLFILYQLLYCISSLLTPCTILLMMYGVLAIIFGHNGDIISGTMLLCVLLMPVTTFVCISLFKKEKQLLCAQVVSFILFVLMVLVIAGLIQSIAEEPLCSTSTLFLCFITGICTMATILHPQEYGCVKYTLLYFLAIPSTSIILFLYAIANMDEEQWGTREHQQSAGKEKPINCNYQLSEDEQTFWKKNLVEIKYLKPNTCYEISDMSNKLHNLRNNSFLLVLIVNTVAVLLMFCLEYSSSIKKTLSVHIPCQSTDIIIQPISVMFSIVFGVFLFVQFIMMLSHRWSTLLHTLSSTDIFAKEQNEIDSCFEEVQTVYIAFQQSMDIIIANDYKLDNLEKLSQVKKEPLAKHEELIKSMIDELREGGFSNNHLEKIKSNFHVITQAKGRE